MPTPVAPADVVTREFQTDVVDNAFPWCDTCKLPAVYNEFMGLRHSVPGFRCGLPAHLDLSGHEVSVREWWNGGWNARRPGLSEEGSRDGIP